MSDVKRCPHCGDWHYAATKYCRKCLDRKNALTKQRREALHAAGRCIQCGNESKFYRCRACERGGSKVKSVTHEPPKDTTPARERHLVHWRREAVMDALRTAESSIEYAIRLHGTSSGDSDIEVYPELTHLRKKFEDVADLIQAQQIASETAAQRRARKRFKRRLGAQG